MVRWYVGWLVGWLVGRLVGRLVGWFVALANASAMLCRTARKDYNRRVGCE